jgi:TENA/THI-4/PQQC family.
MIREIREKISELNNKILSIPSFIEIEKLKLFYDQQWYIVNYDLKSLAIMVSRANKQDEIDFFINAMLGDYEGLKLLRDVAEKTREPIPEAVSYTHYLSWLANYANTGEQVLALVINFPIWAEKCKKLAENFKGRYDIKFLEFFANAKLNEKEAEDIIKRYEGNYLNIARMIQYYEYLFWNAIVKY